MKMDEKGQLMTCPQATKRQQNKKSENQQKAIIINQKYILYAVKTNLTYKILYVYTDFTNSTSGLGDNNPGSGDFYNI